MADRFNPSDVERFYDDFLDRRMVDYRVAGNLRIEMASQFLTQHVDETSRVLDIGCGIGIVTERLAQRAKRGTTLGVDLSARNVWYARRTTRAPNLHFLAANVLDSRQLDVLADRGPYDLITLVDVIEHIPTPEVPSLIARLAGFLAPRGTIGLTFPHPVYQAYLRASAPEELQPVDEDVTAAVLESAAASCGLSLLSWQAKTVWRSEQYVHALLGSATLSMPAGDARGVRSRASRAWSRRVLQPLRRWYYVDRVFKDEP